MAEQTDFNSAYSSSEVSFEFDGVKPLQYNTCFWMENDEVLVSAFAKFRGFLDEFQSVVVNQGVEDNLACIASAGSGKTQTMVSRAIKVVLEDKIPPRDVTLITFTNKASKELKARFFKFFETAGFAKPEEMKIEIPIISTIHSYGAWLTRTFIGQSLSILTDYPTRKLIRKSIVHVFEGEKVEQSYVMKLADLAQEIQANNELYAFVIPVFDEMGFLLDVKPISHFQEFTDREKKIVKNFSRFSFSYLVNKAERDQSVKLSSIVPRDPYVDLLENIEDLRSHYASKVESDARTVERFFVEFSKQKWMNNLGDYSDMIYYPFAVLSQCKRIRESVQDSRKHTIIDEAQDCSPMDISLIVSTDRATYNSISKDLEDV